MVAARRRRETAGIATEALDAAANHRSLALVAGRHPQGGADEPGARRARCAGPGWFDSSWELRCGLEVREEDWSPTPTCVAAGSTDFLGAQRTTGRIASPSASTAIA